VKFIPSNHRSLLWKIRGKLVFEHLKCQYFSLTDSYYPQLFVNLWESEFKVLNWYPVTETQFSHDTLAIEVAQRPFLTEAQPCQI